MIVLLGRLAFGLFMTGSISGPAGLGRLGCKRTRSKLLLLRPPLRGAPRCGGFCLMRFAMMWKFLVRAAWLPDAASLGKRLVGSMLVNGP